MAIVTLVTAAHKHHSEMNARWSAQTSASTDNQVDPSEPTDLSVTRREQRATCRDDVQADDQPTVPQIDRVGDVVPFDGCFDRATYQRGHQGAGNDRADRRETEGPPAVHDRFQRADRHRDQQGDDGEGDHEIEPHRGSPDRLLDRTRNPPDDAFDELMRSEDDRDGRTPVARADEHGAPRRCRPRS